MSLVLPGATSGSVTIDAPAVAGTSTLTLPALTGTILTTASSGQVVPSAALPVGSILQVVNATYATQTTTTSNSFVDTGLTASITPKFATSKILVIVNQTGCGKDTNDTTLNLQLLRGSTALFRFEGSAGWTAAGGRNFVGSCSCSYLDSPATTSSVTYKTQQLSFNGGTNSFTQFNVGAGSPTSTITLMEIAA